MAFDFEQQRNRSNQYNNDLLAQAKANYKGELGVGGVRGFNDFVKGAEGLRIGNVTSGTRNGIGSGNSNWMVNPDTGREERAFAGSDGLYYLESDLTKRFGNLQNAAKAFGQANPQFDDRSPLYWSAAQQSNDAFSGKDGLQDLITIGSMAAVPWTAGALGGLAGAEAGAGAVGDASIGGGVGYSSLSSGGAMMPPAMIDSGGLAGMSSAASGGASLMPPAVAESGATLSQFPSAQAGLAGAAGVSSPSEVPMEQPQPTTPTNPSEIGMEYPAGSPPPPPNDIWTQLKSLMDPASAGLKATQNGLGIIGGLYSMYNANQMDKQLNDSLNRARANQAQPYDYSQNWDSVNEYMNNPMSLLSKNPGYLASVDYITGQEGRKAAGAGLTNSGNRVYNTANSLGQNAEKWYTDMWNPIRDAAGLQRPDLSSQLLDTQTRATGQINTAKQNAAGDIFKKTADSLPNLFKWLG